MTDCQIVSICILSGDGGWQVRDVDFEEKGCQDGEAYVCGFWKIDIFWKKNRLLKNRYVQFLIIAEVWKQADSSENCREAGVGSVANYPQSDFETFSKIEKSLAGRM